MDGQELVKQTLDQIPQANSNAKRIVGLVKENGRITGYQLSDNSIVEKQQAVDMAKQGQIAGVGIAYCGDTEYLKSIPDGSENNNLGRWSLISVMHPVPGRRIFGCFGSNFAVCGVFVVWSGICLPSSKQPSFRPKPCSILLAAFRCICSFVNPF